MAISLRPDKLVPCIISGLMLCFFCTDVFSQTVLTESILTDRIGTTENITVFDTETIAGLQSIVDANGENQSWDFGTVTFTDSSQIQLSLIELPAALPGASVPELANADFVEYVSAVEGMDTLKTLLYQSLEAGNLLSHGTVLVGNFDGVQDTLVTLESPPGLDGVLPFTYEQVYNDSSSLVIDGVPELTYVLKEVTADGWGTLVTPQLSAPALRLFNREMTYLTANGDLLSTFYSIDFISAEGITAEIELDEAMQPVSASYALVNTDMSTGIDFRNRETPTTFSLNQNYPNPFNPATNISFDLFEASRATLKIYSLTGQHMATLVDGFFPAGAYEIALQAGHFSSGLYLYSLETGAGKQTRVMSLIK